MGLTEKPNKLNMQLSAVVTRSNIVYVHIVYHTNNYWETEAEYESDDGSTKDTP